MVAETGLLNAVLTGIVTGSVIALGAIGLALVYDIADVPNFAHGDILTLGAYVALLVNVPGTVPGFGPLTAGPRSLTAAGQAVLFVLTAVSVLAIVYHLGGRRALAGGWWGIDVSPPVGLGVHAGVAVALGALVAFGAPSFLVALVFATLVAGALIPVMESRVFRKFRAREASLAMMLIVSLALSFILRYGIQTVFGGQIRRYQVDSTIPFGGGVLDITQAKNVDLALGTGGLSVAVRETGNAATQLLALRYGWLEILAILTVAALIGVAGYRRRQGTAAVIGPRLAASVGALGAIGVGGVVFAGGSTLADPTFITRVDSSPLKLATIGVALLMMTLLHYLLRATTLGKAMRATSDNRDLAMIRGINTRRVMMSVWIIAGLFGAVGGVLLGFVFANITINLGFNLLIPMFAGVILGGISVYGAILGSYIVGLAMEVGIYAIPGLDTTYRMPVAFVVLLLVLLIKPEGITGGN